MKATFLIDQWSALCEIISLNSPIGTWAAALVEASDSSSCHGPALKDSAGIITINQHMTLLVFKTVLLQIY